MLSGSEWICHRQWFSSIRPLGGMNAVRNAVRKPLYAALQLYKARAPGWQGIFTPLLTSAKPSRRVQKCLAKFKRLYRGDRFRARDWSHRVRRLFCIETAGKL